MVAGGRGFAEYNIWIDDYDQRIAANQGLDAKGRAVARD
jgi:hypothetical protein